MIRFSAIFGKLVPIGTKLPILAGPLRGCKWIAGAAEGEGKGLSVVANRCEPNQLKKAHELVQPHMVCYDIGANVGLYTLVFARRCKHVYAFEPLPRNIRYLWATIHANQVRNATIVPCAVSDKMGLAQLLENGHPSRAKLDLDGTQPVVTVTCDTFAKTCGQRPSLLKIDVEGNELSVLQGAKTLLQEQRPAVLLSTHGTQNRENCLAFLRDLGYPRAEPLNAKAIDSATEFAIVP